MELVKRDDVIDVWHIRVPDEDKEDFLRAIKGLPTVDGRIKGEWKDYIGEIDKSMWYRDDGLSVFMRCSECGGIELRNLRLHRNYCPECGADMRGEK